MSGLWLGYEIGFLKNKQTKISAAAQGSEHDNMKERRRQPNIKQKRKMNIGRFKLFLHR